MLQVDSSRRVIFSCWANTFVLRHRWRLLTLSVFFVCICLVLNPTTGHGQITNPDDTNVDDVLVPGSPPPPPTNVAEKHPWTIVEIDPPLSNPRAAARPMQHDSPRSLMWSLGRALDAYHEALIIHGRNYSSQEQLDWIQNLITRCFDVSQTAPEFQQSTATDAGVFLRELLIRVPLPSWETLPDAKEIAEMPEDQRPSSYRFGEVPIHLVKLDTGDRAGEWVVSKGTLKVRKRPIKE